MKVVDLGMAETRLERGGLPNKVSRHLNLSFVLRATDLQFHLEKTAYKSFRYMLCPARVQIMEYEGAVHAIVRCGLCVAC